MLVCTHRTLLLILIVLNNHAFSLTNFDQFHARIVTKFFFRVFVAHESDLISAEKRENFKVFLLKVKERKKEKTFRLMPKNSELLSRQRFFDFSDKTQLRK